MSYIGVQSQNQISPQFSREVINGDGSATQFTLIQDVPGFNADNIMVVVNNVIQEPVAAYTIKEDANGNPRVLDFGAGNVLSTTDECYVQHRGVGTLNMTPAAGSVNAAALQDNLRSGNVDSFTATAGQTAFTLTETPLNAQSISVFVNGIYQKPTTNFTVSGTTLTLTAGAVAGDEIDVIHHTIRTTVTHVADGSVTSGKLDTNIQVAGTLGVTGNVTASADLSVAGNLTVSGTTTTIDTTVTTSDAMVVNNAGSDVGLKINSTSSGNILQLQDGGADVMVVKDGGNIDFSNVADTIVTIKSDEANGSSNTDVQLKLRLDGADKYTIGVDDDDSDKLKVFTGGGFAGSGITMDSSGNVGIGTTSPATTTNNRKNLQVGLGATVIGRTDDTPNFLSSNLTYNSGWKYIANTTASQVELGSNIEFHTAPSGTAGNAATLTERMRIANSGDGDVTVQTGNLVIGTAGKGINFHPQGGSNVNLLDDYEEGTFDLTIHSSPAGYSFGSYTNHQNCKYTKIGRKVFLQGRVKFGTVGSSNSYVKLSNLPFGCDSTNIGTGVVNEASSTNATYACQNEAGTNRMYIFSRNGSITGSTRTIRTDELMYWSLTYTI